MARLEGWVAKLEGWVAQLEGWGSPLEVWCGESEGWVTKLVARLSYSSSLGSNPDISQKYKMDDTSKAAAKALASPKILQERCFEPL